MNSKVEETLTLIAEKAHLAEGIEQYGFKHISTLKTFEREI